MPQWRSVLLHLQQRQLPLWSSRRERCRAGLPLGFFHYHQGQLGTAKERDLESPFSARALFPCGPARSTAVPWPRAHVAGAAGQHRRPSPGLRRRLRLCHAPCSPGLTAAAPGTGTRSLPRPVWERARGPSSVGPAPWPKRAGPAPQRSRGARGAAPRCRRAPRRCRRSGPRAGQRALAAAPGCSAAQTSYTSAAALPAPTSSWPGHWEASRQTGVGMGPVELLQLLLGCWPRRKAMWHPDPRGLGPAIADTC